MADHETDRKDQDMQDGEEFSFMDEHIKDRPFSFRRLFIRAVEFAVLGFIFGLVAYMAFTFVAPRIHTKEAPSEKEVTIPKDTPTAEADDHTDAEDGQKDADASEEGSGGTEMAVEPEKPAEPEKPDEPEPAQTDDPEEPEEEKPIVLTAENYQQMTDELNHIAAQARHSIVTVIGVLDDEDTFNAMYVNPKKAAGVIVAQTSSELLILAPSFVLNETAGVRVTFGNSQNVAASLKMDDASTGLAVFSVALADLSDATKTYYQVATLGNSYSVLPGSPVILIGRLFGADNGQAFGSISSTGRDYTAADAGYRLLTSDVGGGSRSSGVFLNLQGEVIGFILPENSDGNSSAISAYPISDIKNEIENLSNGTPVPYLGVYGIDINQAEAEEQGLQEGIYITQVILDSPAMAGGLQNGDIIASINGETVTTLQTFRTALFEYNEGDELNISVNRPGKDGYTIVTCTVTLGTSRNGSQ